MPSYVITGASRGIGLAFVHQLSSDPDNTVFGLARDKETAGKLTTLEGGNVHVLQADVTDYKALKAAAARVSQVTGGILDMLINNAATINSENDWRNLTDYDGEEDLLEQDFDRTFKVNVIGIVHATNAFLPLLHKGSTKKVVTIGSSGGERDFVYKTGLVGMSAYGASKAAAHMIVTKYAAQFKDEGFIFIALSPGLVDTSATAVGEPSAKNQEWLGNLVNNFMKAFPNFPGMLSPVESVTNQLKVISDATAKDNGQFLSLP